MTETWPDGLSRPGNAEIDSNSFAGWAILLPETPSIQLRAGTIRSKPRRFQGSKLPGLWLRRCSCPTNAPKKGRSGSHDLFRSRPNSASKESSRTTNTRGAGSFELNKTPNPGIASRIMYSPGTVAVVVSRPDISVKCVNALASRNPGKVGDYS